jgi:dTDP-4-amino-4,6-dideoxy-D-galactose acyltransferase
VTARGTGFFQVKVGADDIARVGSLEAAGFRTIDVNVTFRRDAGQPVPASELETRYARADDRAAVAAIAQRHVSVSRFHLDPQIPDEVATTIKRDWAENFFRGARGDRMLVVERGGEVVGFELVLDTDAGSIIDLIAVTAPQRGHGAGSALVSGLIASRPECPVLVGTQVSNIGAMRFYERLGFTAAGAQFVLHRHA